MGIMRQKRKKLVIAAMAGFAVGVVPMGAVAVVAGAKYFALDDEYTSAVAEYMPYTAYVLNKNKSKGEQIENEDLKEVVVYSNEELEKTDKQLIAGNVIRQKTEAGVIITESMVYEDSGITDDLRMYYFDYIIVPEQISKDAVFDIRISFPNGEDYIVAKGKKMESRTEEGVFINATEKELLMISSAYVDTTIYEGAKIYASIYVSDYQNFPEVNYPVNMYVTELASWNPNLVEEIEKSPYAEKRAALEENLYDFMGVTISNTYYRMVER